MMSIIEVVLKNCWNIDEWTILIEENKLNIKHAINWTWKSTIARAINYHINWDEKDKNTLIPYKHKETDLLPEVISLKNVNRIFLKTYTKYKKTKTY